MINCPRIMNNGSRMWRGACRGFVVEEGAKEYVVKRSPEVAHALFWRSIGELKMA